MLESRVPSCLGREPSFLHIVTSLPAAGTTAGALEMLKQDRQAR